jgi:hypothetical protein
MDRALQLARWVWGVHFRIPEPIYWGVLIAAIGATAALARTSAWVLTGVFIGGLALGGAIRWQWDRHRCRGSLVVARFYEGGGTAGHGDEAQRIVVDSLRTNLPPRHESAVQPISIVVGSDERKFATQLTRRLSPRAPATRTPGRLAGRWMVRPAPGSSADLWIDRSRGLSDYGLDARAGRIWSAGVTTSHQQRVLDEEYPVDFCHDLEGVIRGTAGLFAVVVGEFAQGETLLRDALSRAPESTIPQFDALRVALAWSITNQGRSEEADHAPADESVRHQSLGLPAAQLQRRAGHPLSRREGVS